MGATFEQRLKKLMLFRLVVVTTLLLVAISVEAVSESLLPVNPLYFIIIATYAFTVFHALALRFWNQYTPQVYIQVILDLVSITSLVYATGGIRAGFTLLYPLSVLSGSVLLNRRGGLTLAAIATAFYLALLTTVRMHLIPTYGFSDILLFAPKALFYSVFVTGIACVTVALIGSYFSENLQSVGTRLEEVEGQVADLQELNEVIVNSLQSGLLTANSAGQILFVNFFGESILGRRAEDIRGHSLREVLGSRLLESSALQVRATSGELARLELPYVREDQRAVQLGVSVSPLATKDPGRSGYLMVFQDLTEIKSLEQEIQTKEKLAAVGEMAAHLAHEIRNPLASISGSAQVLMAESNMSVEQENLLAIITRESKRLSDTLNQFLFQAKSPPRPFSPVDLGPVIREAVTLLRNGLEPKSGHQVEIETDIGPHLCRADPDQITQVFWNLARNGLEAMPEGGLLRVRLTCQGSDLSLVVQDQGRGIGLADQRRLFEPFQSNTPMGIGLGLAIVYRIVRDHQGDITVRSVLPRGTEVEVRLPIVSIARVVQA